MKRTSESLRSVAYYQGIVFELLRQLGPGFTLRLLGRRVGYMARLRLKGGGKESRNGK